MIRILIFTCFLFFLTSQNTSAQQLVSTTLIDTISFQEMKDQFGLLAQNGARQYKMLYTTTDVFGAQDTASGLLVVPVRDKAIMPLLCYQHGTADSKTAVPSNKTGEASIPTAFAGLGYVSAAPDYLGLGESRGFHPYVHAASEASVAIDMLFAVQEFAAQENILLNDQLFITGYSQGGHAAMALHREIETNSSDKFTVTAASHMSGPYSVSGEMTKVSLGEEEYFFPSYLANTALSYNMVYDLGYDMEEIFKQPYAEGIVQYFDGDINLGDLNDMLITQLQQNEGMVVMKYMIQDSILESLESKIDHPLNQAFKDNDVYDWAPQAPTRLMYCMSDDQVIYTNSLVADSVINSNGAPDVESIDINSAFDHGQCVEPAVLATVLFFGLFQDVQTGTRPSMKKLQVNVYPNPASNYLLIENTPQDARLQIVGLDGKVHLTEYLAGKNTKINVSFLEKGMYFVNIVSPEGYWSGHIIK